MRHRNVRLLLYLWIKIVNSSERKGTNDICHVFLDHVRSQRHPGDEWLLFLFQKSFDYIFGRFLWQIYFSRSYEFDMIAGSEMNYIVRAGLIHFELFVPNSLNFSNQLYIFCKNHYFDLTRKRCHIKNKHFWVPLKDFQIYVKVLRESGDG